MCAERLKRLGENLARALARQAALAVPVEMPCPKPLGHFADDDPALQRVFASAGKATTTKRAVRLAPGRRKPERIARIVRARTID